MAVPHPVKVYSRCKFESYLRHQFNQKVTYYEYISVEPINKNTVNIKIKELEKLLTTCKNPAYRYRIEVDLTSYRTVKRLLDTADDM